MSVQAKELLRDTFQGEKSRTYTQMPNGRIFVMVAQKPIIEKSSTTLLELIKQDMSLEIRVCMKEQLFLNGSMTSMMGKIFISGSSLGRTKTAIKIDVKGTDYVVT